MSGFFTISSLKLAVGNLDDLSRQLGPEECDSVHPWDWGARPGT
jgi:hypothetical protein